MSTFRSKQLLLFLYILPQIFSGMVMGQQQDSAIVTFELKYDKEILPPNSFYPFKTIGRPKIGVALSGGGIRGLAQIGVLNALSENNIPVDFIAGSSIGAVIGGAYAAGYSPEELWERVKQIDWTSILSDKPARQSLFVEQKKDQEKFLLQVRFEGLTPYIPQAITPGQQLASIIADLIMLSPFGYVTKFDSLHIPLRILTTDLTSGEKVLFNHGNLVDAMRASIAIPLLFTPLEYENKLLADGGLVDNIPVADAKTGNVDLVIAIDTTSPLRPKEELGLPWKMADQVTSIMQVGRNQEMLNEADLVISLEDEKRSSTDTRDLHLLFDVGREKTLENIDAINSLIEARQINRTSKKYFIENIRYEHVDPLIIQFILNCIEGVPPCEISSDEIYRTLEKIYQIGYFKDVRAKIGFNSESTTLIISAQANPVLNGILFTGNHSVSDSALSAQIESTLHLPINAFKSQKDILSILKQYRKKGYALARVKDCLYDSTNGLLTISIDEGYLNDIIITGNVRTKKHVILRELGIKRGSIFNLHEVKAGIVNIYATGLFETVTFSVDEPNSRLRNLVIKIKERPFEVARIGGRYDNERSGIGHLEIAEDNLLGTGTKLVSYLSYGSLDQDFGLKMYADRLFRSYTSFTFDVYHNRKQQHTYAGHQQIGEYNQETSVINFSVGQHITRVGTVSLEGGLRYVHMQPLSGRVFQTGDLNLKTLTLRSLTDSRDVYPFPKSGNRHEFFYEYATGKYKGSDLSFFKVFSSFESWFSFRTKHTVHTRLTWGSSDQTAPFSEQFNLGGQQNFLGLRKEEWVGRHLLLGGIDYRFNVPLKLPISTYLSIHYALGAVWKNAVDVKAKNFINSVGVSFSVNSPLGPISAAYGWVSDGRDRFYFSIGHSF